MTIADKLALPFSPELVQWKPQKVSGNRCLAVCYVDARAIMNRLDNVLGIDGWETSFQVIDPHNVICTLRCKIGPDQSGWISKSDAGQGDDLKASTSDALKRAAVSFGIGRYLYSMPCQWVEYDEKTKTVKPAREMLAHLQTAREEAVKKLRNGKQAKAS